MNPVIRESTTKVGTSRGRARIWLEGKWLVKAGFVPGLFLAVNTTAKALELRPADTPTSHRVSAKQQGDVAVIDLNNQSLSQLFPEGSDLHVRVERNRIVIRLGIMAERLAARPRDRSVGSLFSGAGLLDAAARQAGFTPRFGVEWNPKYADLFQENAPEATMFNLSVHEALLRGLPPVELLLVGVPCESWSRARTLDRTTGAKRDRALPATAHELGDMSLWALAIIAQTNPRTVVIECAPTYGASETGVALQGALRRLGYVVSDATVSPHEYGYIARRARTAIVAQTPDDDGTVPTPFPSPRANTTTLGDLLDADVPEAAWFNRETKAWLYAHADRHNAKGNGFAASVMLDPRMTVVPTIKKRYFAQQGDGPRLPSPTIPDTHRWLSLNEVRRIMGVPEDFHLGDALTTAGEVVGQGVHVPLWGEIIRLAAGAGAPRRVTETSAVSCVAVGVCDDAAERAGARTQGDLFA